MTDLSLVSTDDLFAEIARRVDAAVIVLARKPADSVESWSLRFSGGRTSAVGLVEMAKDRLLGETGHSCGRESCEV